MMAKKVIQAVALPREPEEEVKKLKDLAAKLAYYYPQYTYQEALDLPILETKRLLRIQKQERLIEWHMLTQIAAAPHTEKGKGVKKLLDKFDKELKS